MFCINCGNRNRDGANFCKKCGQKIVAIKDEVSEKVGNAIKEVEYDIKEAERKVAGKIFGFSPKRNFFRKSQLKWLFIGLTMALLVGLAPEAWAYYGYYSGLDAANKMFDAENYSGALSRTEMISKKLLLPSSRKKLDDAINRFSNARDCNNELQSAISIREQGDLEKAKNVFSDFVNKNSCPQLAVASAELSKVNDAIATRIKADAETKVAKAQREANQASAKAASEAANRRVAEDAAAASRAQADAAAQAKAASDAQAARAAQEAARQAQERDAEVKRSFYNQVVNAYNSFMNQAFTSYSIGIKYSNSGEHVVAVSNMITAKTVLNSISGNISGINNRFNGLPANYYSASNNMLSAVNQLIRACDLVIDSEGTDLDYSAAVNDYISSISKCNT